MTASRKRRGAATQAAIATWFQATGWPYAESTGAGRQGSDITGLPGLACEIKARSNFSPLAWIKQARAGAKASAAAGFAVPAVSFVVLRCNGQGPATIGDWPVLLPLEDFTALLQSAGYGDGDPRLRDCTHGADCQVHPGTRTVHNFDQETSCASPSTPPKS